LSESFGSETTGRSSYSTLISFSAALGDGLRLGRHGGDLVAQAAHAVGFSGKWSLATPIGRWPGHVGGGDHRVHAGQRLRRRGVDAT
jgi:hypothetical protein